jgi:AraC-like DNA-binding protein
VLGQLSCQRHRKEGFRNPISYVPAGMRVWSRVEKLSALRHLDIHLDRDALLRRFGNGLDAQKLDTPRLMFSDDRIMALARLIAGECLDPGGFGDLYGEGLVTAVLGLLFGIDRSSATGKLPARQLRKVLDYIEANCVHSIRLQDLADLAGLSPSYFSAAFKASTGVPPLKWQMQARIERVKTLMRQSPISLTEAAAMSGFADQAHLTRTFKALVGSTPAAWRRNNVR